MKKMINRNVLFSIIIVALIFLSCKSKSYNSTVTSNSKESLEKPYLILISLDGFRWDYVDRFNPPHLSSFINSGVKAESLIPSFPSKTFPNHYTIATGLYPENHGLVGNSFYSNELKLNYAIRDRKMVENGAFYKGTPIWVQANKEGVVSASYFFVGSETKIQGILPTYYHRYDGSVKNEKRVSQVLKWLYLPKEQRPHMITLYFSDMDDTGHRYGPNNDEELKKTLLELDKNLGDLFEGVKSTGLPVNIIVVSDHGMSEVASENYIAIEDVKNDSKYLTVNNGAILNIHPKNNFSTDSIYKYLKKKELNFKVYKTKDTPGFEYIPKNKDWGAIQIIPDFSYYFSISKSIEFKKNSLRKVSGVHGYSPEYKDMHGIFYANGPAFKKGYEIPSVKNIHIYPLMCEILGLDISDNIDGKLLEIENVLEVK
jgi:predicted AlkP superfamily pyrophosphatase or phosphodiesterase